MPESFGREKQDFLSPLPALQGALAVRQPLSKNLIEADSGNPGKGII
jgi:hypothetical protein